MKKYKFKDTKKQAQKDLWLFTGVSVLMILLLVFFGLFNARWDINVLFPGYGVWTKETYLSADIWLHLRYIDGIKVTADTVRASFDIGILLTSTIVQGIATIIYFNERTRRLFKQATDQVYIIMLKIIGKFKSLQADMKFRAMVQELDLNEKTDTWKLLAGLKLERHLQNESKKVLFERTEYPDNASKSNRKNWSKSTIRYIKKEDKLKLQITDKWIDKHIKHINFKYPRITTTMILTGNTSVKISRMAIEDVKSVKAKETARKVITSLLSLVFIAIIGSIISLTFQYDIWKAIKDVLVYMIAIVFAFVWALKSANTIHNSKELEIEDRLGYIQKYVGSDEINKIKKEVTDDTYRKSEIEKMKMQEQIDSLKKDIKELE